MSTQQEQIVASVPAPAKQPRVPWARLGLFLLALATYALINRGQATHLAYFVPLADAFLHGRLHLLDNPPWLNELVPWNGRYYVVYPPMPAVLLLPFVWLLGPGLDQARLSILLGAANVYLISGILIRMGLPRKTWLTYALLFGFGTIQWFSAQVGSSWHFAHVCATLFLLLAVRSAQLGHRPWWIGLLLGCAATSRLPTLMAFPFFGAYLLHLARRFPGDAPFASLRAAPTWRPLDLRRLLEAGGSLAVGLLLPLGAYLLYNQVRFGSPLQTGHSLIPGLLDEHQYRHGFFSAQSIGRNLYAMLLKAPNLVDRFPYAQPPVLGGLSLFLTTPAFLWAIKARKRDLATLGAWAAILLTLVPILLHADPGGDQFGYRYAQDFYPFLFLLAVHGMGDRPSFEARLAIALSLLVNLWGMWATYIHWRG
ncbi:MAG TPA: hypothetical protein V6D00_08760 [Pantanalinema sp.]